MRVLHVIPSVSERSGGPGHAIISMCRSLLEQGTEVFIATTNHGVSSSELQVSSLPSPGSEDFPSDSLTDRSKTRNSKLETRNYKGVPTVFFPVGWGESFKYSKPLAMWLDANVGKFDVVHIHAVFNHASVAAANACRKYKIPYVVRPLGTLDPWSMKQKPLRKFLFWRLAGQRMLKAASAVHYTASAEKSAAETSLKLNHGAVIPLGVNAGFPNRTNRSLLHSSKPTQVMGCSYILVLSRLHPKKGLDILVDAFLSLAEREDFKDWRLVLAGTGPADYVHALMQKVAAHDAEQVVLFPGWLEGDEKDEFLRHASLLALPSYHENFGLCVMEALAFGVPVLISPHVGLASEIEAAGAGWVTEVSKEAVAASLAKALASKDELARRGNAGVRLAKAFSWQKIACQLKELYASIVSEHQSRLS